jgi:hypothetical protein
VVSRNESADAFRSAQIPPVGNAGSTTPPPAQGSPFRDVPSEPQFDTPQLEPPQGMVPPPENRTIPTDQQPIERQPVQVAPSERPSLPPPAGQFQPVLPSGPATPEAAGPPTPATPDATFETEKGKAKGSCEKSLENLRAYTVDKVNLNISVTGTEGKDYPFECVIDDGQQFKDRCWEPTTYLWKASALCHKPLYFEEEQLERYGHSFSPSFQPFVSGAHFFCTLPVLPYCMGVEPPCECIYALGHYRPGSCAPYMCNPVPLSLRGALIQAGAVTGAAAILP